MLDFDTAKADYDGGELLELLIEQEPTITAYTPSKGVHLIYRQRPGLPMTTNGATCRHVLTYGPTAAISSLPPVT